MARDLARHRDICSINTATLGFQAPIDDVIEEITRAGFGTISPWRRDMQDKDIHAVARHIRDAGLNVSGYCRSPYIPAATAGQYRANIEANLRAIDEAAILSAPVFVSTCYGDAGYAQLALHCPQSILRGADDESELGAFHDLFHPQRMAALESRLQEYTPADMQSAVIYADDLHPPRFGRNRKHSCQ